MMTLRTFLLIMVTVLVRHVASSAAASHAVGSESEVGFSINLVVGVCVTFCVLGKALALASALSYPNISKPIAWKRFESRRAVLEWSWLATQAWLLPSSGMAQMLADMERHGAPNSLLMLIWFLPTLIFLAALELSAAQLEMDMAFNSKPVESSLITARWMARLRWGTVGSVAMCLVPVVFVLGIIDAIAWLAPTLGEQWRAALALVTLAVACAVLAPLWMQIWSGAVPMPQDHPLVTKLAAWCDRLQIKLPALHGVGMIRTQVLRSTANDDQTPATQRQSSHNRWHGAAVVGWVSPFRQLWIGGAAAEELSDEQLDMVLLHELAHLKRWHSWIRLLPVLVGAFAIVGLMASYQQAALFDRVETLPAFSLLALGLAAMAGGLSWLSRWCELDADRHACVYASQLCTWAVGRPDRAATELIGALQVLQGRAEEDVWFWLHPATTHRAASLDMHFPATTSPIQDCQTAPVD